MENTVENKERFFSIELQSKAGLKNVTLTNGSKDAVLIEGSIGELVQAAFTEGIILEIIGKKGTLRIDLNGEELRVKLESATTTELEERPMQNRPVEKRITRDTKRCK